MKVTAYRCDCCKSLSEEKPKYFFDPESSNFELKTFSHYYSLDKAACSDDCARGALAAWLAKNNAPTVEEQVAVDSVVSAVSEPKRISFNGIQPS
jgi:hypothetical protein